MKSGYKLLAQEQATAVLTTVGHEIWKQVWSMAAQNKVRNFSWRAIWNSIPTKANLVRWCVIGEDIYDHCQQTPEDVIHALWLCPHLASVWDSNPCWSFHTTTHFHSFSKLVQYVIKKSKNLELLAQTIWTKWYKRNLLRTSNKSFPIDQIIPDVLAALSGFIPTILPKSPDSNTQVPQRVKWKPPSRSYFKINFDGLCLKRKTQLV